MDSIKQSFLAAIQFLKQKKVQGARLYDTPWLLVIGPEKSGKTSMLANSEIHFNLSRKIEKALMHEEPNWWVSNSATFLDIPGDYLAPAQTKTFKQLLKLTKKYCPKNQLQGVMVCLDIKAITHAEDSASNLASRLAERLNEISQSLRTRLPIYLMINQCDRLTGFKEFFNHYAKDERQQSWGFQFYQNNSNYTAQFSQKFNELAERLNQQLIFQLHHEPDQSKKTLIKDFPVQFAQIKPAINTLIKTLSQQLSKNIELKQLNFISANQIKTPNKHGSKLTTINKPFYQKAYFVHDALTQITDISTPRSKRSLPTTMITYILGLLVIGSTATVFAINFTKEKSNINETKTLIQQYQSLEKTKNSPQKIQQEVQLLNQLNKASLRLLMHSPWQHIIPGAKQANTVGLAAKSFSEEKAYGLLAPITKHSLTSALNSSSSRAIQYAALKSSLMLSNTTNFDQNYFKHTLQAIWQNEYKNNPQLQTILSKELASALNSKVFTFQINTAITSSVRGRLLKLKPVTLANAIWQSYFLTKPKLTLNLNQDAAAASVLALRNPKEGIAGIYTPTVFNQLNNGLFRTAANAAINGDPVLGKQDNQHATAEQLQQAIEKIYLNQYKKNWIAFLNNIEIIQANNIPQLKSNLAVLSSDQSPLFQLLTLVHNNIAPITRTDTDSALLEASQLTSTQQESRIQAALASLSNYLSSVNTPEQAFDLARTRMQNNGLNDPISYTLALAQTYPNPIQYWLYQIGSGTWQLLLSTSHNYIEQQWISQAWPEYQAQINNRFPFYSNANQSVSLSNFVNMFAPDNLLDQFFSKYLQAFVNTTQQPWRLKSLNGLSLDLKSTSLQSFQHIQNLRHMFFPNGDQHLFLPFTIQASKFSNNLAQLSFQLGSQNSIFAANNLNNIAAFKWPDDQNSQLLNIAFLESNSHANKLSFNGPWGLWQLMEKSQLQKMKVANHWQGVMTQGDDAMTFTLGTKSKNNPFSLNTFSGIKLAQTI